MKTICNWSTIVLLAVIFLGIASCDKNDNVKLIDSEFETVEISCGDDLEIPVLTNNWIIESVKDIASGQELSDKDGNPLALDGKGQIEASNGWLTLIRDNEETFILSLKENFDTSHERKFLICINDAGKRDYVTVVQQAGTAYQLVKSEYEEIEEHREIYISDKECISIVLSNSSPIEVWEPTGRIFENVVESSVFESDDYGAFDWVPEEGVEIAVPELIIAGAIRWHNRCTYKEGTTTIPFIKDIPNGNKILMNPYSTLYLNGEITYCKRLCNYNFTIQNIGTGTRFNIKGVWTQVVPISSDTIISDKEF